MNTEKRLFEIFAFGLSFKISAVDSKGTSSEGRNLPTLETIRRAEKAKAPKAVRRSPKHIDEKSLQKDVIEILESQPEIRSVFGWSSKRMASIDLAEALRNMPGGKWRSITPCEVATALRSIHLRPRSLRRGNKVVKGYLLHVDDNKGAPSLNFAKQPYELGKS